jgi:hypothetical protein
MYLMCDLLSGSYVYYGRGCDFFLSAFFIPPPPATPKSARAKNLYHPILQVAKNIENAIQICYDIDI